MPRINKSWAEKMASKSPHRAVLEGDFAGLKKGSSLHISSPQEIASELKKYPVVTRFQYKNFGAILQKRRAVTPPARFRQRFFYG